MERKITHVTTEAELNNLTRIPFRVWIFRTQELMDLWRNTIQPQISDGYWKNCKKTRWLYDDGEIYMLGDETKLLYRFPISFSNRKMDYSLTKELREIIGEKAMEVNGFRTITELSKAWKEIADAIKNVDCGYDNFNKYVNVVENNTHRWQETTRQYIKEHCDPSVVRLETKRTSYEYFAAVDEDGKENEHIVLHLQDSGKIHASFSGYNDVMVPPEKLEEVVKVMREYDSKIQKIVKEIYEK